MTDFATLVLGADARNLKDGAVALDQIADKAEKTEARVTRSNTRMSDSADLLAATVRATTSAETVARLATADAAQKSADRVAASAAARAKAEQLAAEAAARAMRQEEMAREILAASYASLRASLDPLYAASMQYSSAVDTVSAAVKAGIVSQDQANRVLMQAERAYLAVTPAAAKAERAVAVAGREMIATGQNSRNMGFMIQNSAFQIGDMAVQIAGGTSAMRAMSMQLPQLLGGFGVWGAVIGAAVAVVGALAPALFGAGKEAKTAADKLDDANAALEAFQANAKLAMTDATELAVRFGRWGDQIAFNARMMAQQNIVNAQTALQQASLLQGLDAVVAAQAASQKSLKDYLGAQKQFADGTLTNAEIVKQFHADLVTSNEGLVSAAAALGLTTDQALKLNVAMDAVSKSQSVDQLADSANAALQVFYAIPPEVIAANQALSDTQVAMFQLAQNAAAAAVTAKQMTDAFAPAKAILDRLFASDASGNWLQNALVRAGLLAGKLMDAARAYAAASLSAGVPALAGPAGMTTGETPAGVRADKLAADQAIGKKLIAQLGQIPAAAAKAGGSGKAAMDKIKTAAEELADTLNKYVNGAVDNLAGAFGDFVASGFQKFGDFTKGIRDSFKGLLSDLIKTSVANPIKIAMGMTQDQKTGAWGVNPSSMLGNVTSGIGAFTGGIGTGLSGVLSGFASGGLSGAWGSLTGSLAGASSGLAGLGAAIGAIAAPIAVISLLFSAFRTKTTLLDSGLQVTVDGMDALVKTFSKVEKSSFFGLIKRTSTTSTTANSATTEAVQVAVEGVENGVINAAKALGIASSAFDSFTYSLSVSTKGMTQDQAIQAVQAKFAEMGDAMAGMVTGLDDFRRPTEGLATTLQRLATAAQAVNTMTDTMGLSFKAVGLAGASLSSDLVDRFGGVDAMVSATSAYYQAFYTDAERAATLTRQTTAAFSDLGLTMPATRDGFRALVEAQDLTTEAGRKTFAALIGLTGAMDQVLPAAASMSAAISGLVNASGGQLTDLISQTGTALTAAKSAASSWYQAAEQLRTYIADLRGASSDITSAAQARAYNEVRFQTAMAAALAGSQTAYASLTGIAGDLLASTKATAHTSAEAAISQARVIADLSKAAGVADVYGARNDVTAELLQDQVDILTSIKDYLGAGGLLDAVRLEALNGQLGNVAAAITAAQTMDYPALTAALAVAIGDTVSDPVVSLTAPLTAVRTSLSDLAAAVRAQTAFEQAQALAAAQAAAKAKALADAQSAAQKALAARDAAIGALKTSVEKVNAFDTSTGGWIGKDGKASSPYVGQYGYLNYSADGVYNASATDLAKWRAAFWSDGGLEDQMIAASEARIAAENALIAARNQVRALGGTPAFAGGGWHTGGVRIVGERGPEIEATGAARYYSASKTKAMLTGDDDDATAAEIRALREDLRRAADKDRADRDRMLRTMDNWTVAGLLTRTS